MNQRKKKAANASAKQPTTTRSRKSKPVNWWLEQTLLSYSKRLMSAVAANTLI